jgi:hypothetical protein
MAATVALAALCASLANAAPPPPVGAILNGTCGATTFGGDCDTAPKGAFKGVATLAACVAKVKACKMGNYASFSNVPGNQDCSWYSECDTSDLCKDCSKPASSPTCPPAPGCPKYYPYQTEVVKAVKPAPPGPPMPAPLPAAMNLTVAVAWTSPAQTASTSATVEVDVMPFLSRSSEGGPFDAYFTALSNLGAEYVRYSPWYPYPKVVVPELTPPDCTATKPATNWNSALFDGIVRDFMEAVCGEGAITGVCEHSVAQQLSTMPDWIYQGAYPVPAGVINPDPWKFNAFNGYNRGSALVNESCIDMGMYMGRLVSHYTAGGHHDTCGHWHESGFHYNWTVLSVLNENEHNTGGPRYIKCFDQIRKAVEGVNKYIKLAGPETVGNMYINDFLDPKNHDDGRSPEIMSHHAFLGMGSATSTFFHAIDGFMSGDVAGIVKQRDAVSPKTEMVLNEWIPFLTDWCDEDDAQALFEEHGDALARDPRGGACPNWQDPKSQPTRANRKTLGWNVAAGSFAYGYARLALVGYKYVGADQLIGGPWPDNEPAVSCLDWKSGQPNAKYWAIHMLAKEMGTGVKSLFNASVSVARAGSGPPPPPAGGGCFMQPKGAVNYKFAPGNVFPDDPKHPHGLRLTDSTAGCCKLCQGLKNCSFFTYSAGGDAVKPTCYSQDGGCCFLKTAEGGIPQSGCATCESGSTKPLPAAPSTDILFAMPYILHDTGKRGVLLINKKSTPLSVTLHGAGVSGVNTTAQVLDGTIDVKSLDPEPGFVPPVDRVVRPDGVLALGPYAIALVHAGTQ